MAMKGEGALMIGLPRRLLTFHEGQPFFPDSPTDDIALPLDILIRERLSKGSYFPHIPFWQFPQLYHTQYEDLRPSPASETFGDSHRFLFHVEQFPRYTF